MESLQVDKEQIQLVISPDTVSQKKNWCSSDVPGRDQLLNMDKANMTVNDGRHQQLPSINPPKCPTAWAEHFIGTVPRWNLHKTVLTAHSHESWIMWNHGSAATRTNLLPNSSSLGAQWQVFTHLKTELGILGQWLRHTFRMGPSVILHLFQQLFLMRLLSSSA